MAEFIEEQLDDEEFDDVTQTSEEDEVVNSNESEEEVKEPQTEELPEKYRGKSASEIAKMHQELEKLHGKHAQEVGELRKLTDEILRQQLESKKPVEDQEIDFFTDPDKAIEQKINNHPTVKQAQQTVEDLRKKDTLTRLATEFPGFDKTVQSPDFVEWVLKSNVRKRLYAEANATFDYDSASELLSTWNELKSRKSAEESAQIKDDMQKVTKQAKQAASVDSGGAGEVSKKIYRRADLIRLKMNDPARYEALADEIMSAYADGRVR